MSNMKTSIYALIAEIAAAEKITRVKLGVLSRDMLLYVPDSNDIDAVNRLLGVLTPVNRKAAIHFFGHFLMFEQEKDNDGVFQRFGKRLKGEKKIQKKMDAIAEFLKDENNTIWTWADHNLDLNKKKNFVGMIENAIKKAIEGDEKSDTPPLTMVEIVRTVMNAGVDIDTLLEGVEERLSEREAQEKEANSVMEQPVAQAA